MLNTTPATLDPTAFKNFTPPWITFLLRDPPTFDEGEEALAAVVNGKALGPDEPHTEVLKLGLIVESSTFHTASIASSPLFGRLARCHGSGGIPLRKKGRAKCGTTYRGVSIVAYAEKILLTTVASSLATTSRGSLASQGRTVGTPVPMIDHRHDARSTASAGYSTGEQYPR